MKASSNGKGDKPRPVDKDKYRKNYSSIKWNKPKGGESKKA